MNERNGSVLTITGESGIGKRTLAREVATFVRDRRFLSGGTRRLRGVCSCRLEGAGDGDSFSAPRVAPHSGEEKLPTDADMRRAWLCVSGALQNIGLLGRKMTKGDEEAETVVRAHVRSTTG